MNTFQLTCFLAVANTLSFARAAAHLNVTQPTITHQIKALEDELQVKLFRRSTRMVELTTEGQAFVIDAKNMVGIAEQAKKRFRSPADRAVAVLSIGLSNFAQFDLLAESLNQMAGEFPNFHPRLHILPHEQLFRLLENESADIIFCIRESGIAQKKFKYRELVLSSFVGVCHIDYPLAARKQITMEELKAEKLIFCDPFALSSEVAKLQIQIALDKDPVEMHFSSSAASTLVLAMAGMGIAVIPEIFVHNTPQIATIRIIDAPKISFGILYNPHTDNDVLKRFIQITSAHYAARAAAMGAGAAETTAIDSAEP